MDMFPGMCLSKLITYKKIFTLMPSVLQAKADINKEITPTKNSKLLN